ncbi:glycohydrolase toxin TNT-related protein [Mycobacterium stomatepiae]|uniref:Outer membrane channel protein CpnT n=1 Tax=Mycobacterium stomatepiae TaxID=470076 RepID=A0A7I7Q1D7_9MYCO|nr:TNT domain-containing protein [Mycobacterium stomatepiae]MCV7166449.1 glycohydrolase toxin TNT-related protein [Mycobacterium stomatepiae]BBY20123.1 outer membrane channel protein CpnT [Mycobacterium stomatepiae]
MPILAVDPEALFAAGSAVVATGDGLAAAMAVLTAGFGANTGLDVAGELFGLSYQGTAESLLNAAAAAINACRRNGVMIQVDASNWSKAEAASRVGGAASVLQAPAEPVNIGAPGPPGTLGPGEPPPLLWAVVQSFVDDVWPNGDVPALHAAAGCWRTFSSAVSGMRGAFDGSRTLVGTQQIPEGEKIDRVLSQIGVAMDKLGAGCVAMAYTLEDFANRVATAKNDIRNLLHRLESLTDIWHDVVSVLDGDAFEEIKKIARDINAVLHDLGREARAFEQGIKLLMQMADGLVVDMEKYTRGQFTHFLGDAVGNQVATVFDTFVNANEGVVKGVAQAALGMADLTAPWLLLDPKGAEATWKDMVQSQFEAGTLNQIMNPREGGAANLQMWKSLLHLEDWSTARPGLGFGENVFDGATFFLPGLGEAGAGAKAGSAAARGAEEAAEGAGAAGRAGELGEFASTTGALGDIGKVGTNLTKDLDSLKLDVPKTDFPPGGRSVGPPRVENPSGPPPRPVESAPPGTPAPHSPTAPDGLAHGHSEAAAGGAREHALVPAAPAEPLPSRSPQLVEPNPPRLPPAADGAPLDAAPAATPSAQQVPALTSVVPHSSAPSAELPAPAGTGWHAPSDGGSAGGGPHDASPSDSGPYGLGDGGPLGGGESPGPPYDGKPGELSSDGDGPSAHGHRGPHDPEPGDPVHSDAPSGDGWERLPDQPTDPHYGEPLQEHWAFKDDPTELGGIKPSVAELIRDPEALLGRDPHGEAYTAQQYAERFNKSGPTGQEWMNFPGNEGAVPGTKVAFTDIEQFAKFYGRELDRIGNDSGKYLAVMEDGRPASWEERALHVNSLSDPYHSYVLENLPGGWKVEVSEVAPGLGQPGGSIQVRILDSAGRAMTIEELLEIGGVLR